MVDSLSPTIMHHIHSLHYIQFQISRNNLLDIDVLLGKCFLSISSLYSALFRLLVLMRGCYECSPLARARLHCGSLSGWHGHRCTLCWGFTWCPLSICTDSLVFTNFGLPRVCTESKRGVQTFGKKGFVTIYWPEKGWRFASWIIHGYCRGVSTQWNFNHSSWEWIELIRDPTQDGKNEDGMEPTKYQHRRIKAIVNSEGDRSENVLNLFHSHSSHSPHSKLNHDMQKLLATISTWVLAKVSTYILLVPAIHTKIVASRGSRVFVSSSTAEAR